jgi:hypothetical protein
MSVSGVPLLEESKHEIKVQEPDPTRVVVVVVEDQPLKDTAFCTSHHTSLNLS